MAQHARCRFPILLLFIQVLEVGIFGAVGRLRSMDNVFFLLPDWEACGPIFLPR